MGPELAAQFGWQRCGGDKRRLLPDGIQILVLIALVLASAWSGLSPASAATGSRESGFAYDSATGLLNQEVIEPNTTALRLQTDYTHDGFGNKVSVTVSGVDITTRTSSTTFDAYGRFAVSNTNALSHTETLVSDPKFGVVLSQTGPNNITTSWQYDSFGRKIKEIRADGTSTVLTYKYCSGVAGGTETCPTYGAYVLETIPYASDGITQNGPWVKAYHDSHGRIIRTETQGFDQGAPAPVIAQETEYDLYGRTYRESRPYFAATGTPEWTTYTYDTLGRPTLVTLPDASTSTSTYSGLVTSVTNDLNQTQTTTQNARGETIAVTDANGKTTQYAYDVFGNRVVIMDSLGNLQGMTYDNAGRKIASSDPDMGAWTYSYNVLGELISQTDAKSQTSTLTYDVLGRLVQRVEADKTSTWVYDTAAYGIGKLASTATDQGYAKTYTYDSLGRPVSSSTTIDSVTETIANTYDANGRIDTLTYPSGFEVQYIYTALGYEHQLQDASTSAVFWQADTRDQELRLLQSTAGNGVVTTRTFDQQTGTIDTIKAGVGDAVADFSYAFDSIGNLTARGDANMAVTESFTYDVLNRVTVYGVTNTSGTVTKTMVYNEIGNILSKSDVGTYTYAATGNALPHAVASISGTVNTTYTYDGNGNMLTGKGRTLTWTASNMVASIVEGANTVTFLYDAEQSRAKKTDSNGTTYYYSGAGIKVEKVVGATLTTWNEYLYAGGEIIGQHYSKSDLSTYTYYFVNDHLGSVAVITDELGTVTERLSYDAWGKRRNADGSDATTPVVSATMLGFTGHEMIDDVGLVNMNGRIYDPTIGRFMSADPFIQDVTASQNLNRYTYVNNNPLSYTDPSGFFFKKLFRAIKKVFKAVVRAVKKFIRPIIAIAAAVTLQFYALPAVFGAVQGFLSGALYAGISAGVSSVILTGKPKAFLTGFGQGFITYGIGSGFEKLAGAGFTGIGARATKALAHGVVGGAFAEVRGGKFSAGFLAAGFTSGTAPTTGLSVANVIRAAVTGGVGSVLGGGKFADGAVYGAFTYLLNDAAHERRLRMQLTRQLQRERVIDGSAYLVGGGFTTTKLFKNLNGIGIDVAAGEYFISTDDGMYTGRFLTIGPVAGNQRSADAFIGVTRSIQSGVAVVYSFQTGQVVDSFSMQFGYTDSGPSIVGLTVGMGGGKGMSGGIVLNAFGQPHKLGEPVRDKTNRRRE